MHNTKLSSLIAIHSGKDYKHLNNGNVPVYGSGGLMCFVDKPISDHEDAIGIGRKGSIEKIHKLKYPFWTVDTLFWCTSKGYNLSYLKYLIETINLKRYDEGSTLPSLSSANIKKIPISIHSENVVEKISAKLSQIDNLIRSQNKKIKCNIALKNNILDTFFSKEDLKYVEMIPLKNLCTKMRSGGTPKATKSSYYNGDIPFMSISDINNNKLTNTKKNISMIGLNNSSSCIIKKNNIIYTMYATPGIAFVNYIDVAIPQSVISIELKEKDKNIFIKEYLNYVKNNVMRFAMTGTQSNLTAEIVRNIMIPKFDDNKINYICLTLSQMDNFIVVIFTTSFFHVICIL